MREEFCTITAVHEALPSIKSRSGLDDAFERPVASYSQGMRARLGFAVVDEADPQVLLLDEVHEAIDEQFRAHLEASVDRIRRPGGIVIAAGHDRAGLARLCERALLIERSGVRAMSWEDVAAQREAEAV